MIQVNFMTITRNLKRIVLTLKTEKIGDDFFVTLTGGDVHIGAAALAFYDLKADQAICSVMTVSGHRENEIALDGAERICNHTKKTVLFSAGIHLDNIYRDEIIEIQEACADMIQDCLHQLEGQ